MSSKIGLSAELKERGPGLMFRVSNGERIYPGFIVRYDGIALGYLNVCAHVGLRLNRHKNLFFSRDGNLLQCMAHGAAYEPDSGLCARGPCEGLNLIRLNVIEEDESIYLQDSEYDLVDD